MKIYSQSLLRCQRKDQTHLLFELLNLLAMDVTSYFPSTSENVLYEKVETLESSSNILETTTIPNLQDIDILASLLDAKKGDLSVTFDLWMTKVKNEEVARTKIEDDSVKMKESLSRQLQGGIITYNEYIDLDYINRLWIKLLNTMKWYQLGTVCNKRDVISLLLELLELKQISKQIFIDTVTEL